MQPLPSGTLMKRKLLTGRSTTPLPRRVRLVLRDAVPCRKRCRGLCGSRSFLTGLCCLQLDPRFVNAINLIRDGTFGWADIFEALVESITTGGDYYLLANDFPAYVDCQVPPEPVALDPASKWMVSAG